MRPSVVVPAVLTALLTAGCGAQTLSSTAKQPASPSSGPPGAVTLKGGGEFTDADPATAIAYDRALAPKGSQASVTAESSGGTTVTSLVVEGLLPGRAYGAHLHVNKCGAKPVDAGPHFQHEHGAANATNEVWLDLTTDSGGAGTASAKQPWVLDPAHLPGSLVIHAKGTESTGPKAGQAGDRVACLTLS
ncbi:superoxide dismutase family protein [Nonomuraea sp. NBC_01738]|uniref:superoxide dismutase family protein n=1 Tax=Nonomuraea sp. NBC_01738 TaxID=2976003 RepID=UPI002E109866|nr:superoxide dismutase family protein [Nonomuraea sp. NBC_01738]